MASYLIYYKEHYSEDGTDYLGTFVISEEEFKPTEKGLSNLGRAISGVNEVEILAFSKIEDCDGNL